MAELMGYRSKDAIRQNLKDAGCSQTMIKNFMQCVEHGATAKDMKPLREYRRELVDEFDMIERKLHCLDYFLFQVRQFRGY